MSWTSQFDDTSHRKHHIYGSEQLAHLAAKHSQVFEKSYPAEINSVRTSLLERTETEDRIGLRPGLITIGTDDGPALRREILRRTVQSCFNRKAPRAPRWPLRRSRPNLSCHARFRTP